MAEGRDEKGKFVYENTKTVHIGFRTPSELISIAEQLTSDKCKDVFVYDSQMKVLKSLDLNKGDIYYDPIHGVLELKY